MHQRSVLGAHYKNAVLLVLILYMSVRCSLMIGRSRYYKYNCIYIKKVCLVLITKNTVPSVLILYVSVWCSLTAGRGHYYRYNCIYTKKCAWCSLQKCSTISAHFIYQCLVLINYRKRPLLQI